MGNFWPFLANTLSCTFSRENIPDKSGFVPNCSIFEFAVITVKATKETFKTDLQHHSLKRIFWLVEKFGRKKNVHLTLNFTHCLKFLVAIHIAAAILNNLVCRRLEKGCSFFI